MSDQEWPSTPGHGEPAPPPSEPPASTPPPAPAGGTPPPPPPPTGAPVGGHGAPTTEAGRTADVGVRLGARVIDTIILWVVNAIIGAVVLVPILVEEGSTGFTNPMFMSRLSGVSAVLTIIGLVITFAYYLFFDSSRGATPGKMILNLQIEGDGGTPSVQQSFRRNAFMLLGIIPWVGGLLQLGAVIYIAITISQSPDNRGWHDRFADTRVTRTG